MLGVFIGWLKRLVGMGQETAMGNGANTSGRAAATSKSGSSTKVLQPAHTLRLKPEPLVIEHPPVDRTGSNEAENRTRLEWFGQSDVGKVRDHNEDFYFCHAIGDTGLFVVADGMGGHDAGEVASRLAVETLCREMREAADRQGDPIGLLKQSVVEANRTVLREASRKSSNMGTTIGVAFVSENRAFIASVGDSRVYWIRNGSIKQVTEDHSLVAKLVKAGKLSRDEARTHPKSNLLYRTIGSEEDLKVDTFELELQKGDSLLLCSDGLWGEVPDEDMHRICRNEQTTRAVCNRLVRVANENGGKDNITAVVVKVK